MNRITYRKSEFDRERWAAERAQEKVHLQRIAKDSTAGHLPRTASAAGGTRQSRLPPMSDTVSSDFKDFLSMYNVDHPATAPAARG